MLIECPHFQQKKYFSSICDPHSVHVLTAGVSFFAAAAILLIIIGIVMVVEYSSGYLRRWVQ